MTRPRLQLHLITLLIVTLLAAGLFWLHSREYVVRGKWIVSVYDLFFGLALLAVAAAAIEWLTRRMKRET
jgi:hypothetical protein